MLAKLTWLNKFVQRRSNPCQKNTSRRRRILNLEVLEHRQMMAGDIGLTVGPLQASMETAAEIGVIRNQTLLLNTDNDAFEEIDTRFGLPGDQLLTGRFTRSGGTTAAAVRRQSSGLLQWHIDTDGDPEAERVVDFGLPGDIPVVGDWDGDGVDNIGVVRQGHDGLLRWYLNVDDDPAHEYGFVYGFNTDTPVVGDWDGDGVDDAGAVRRQPDGLLHWYLDTDRDPTHEQEAAFGLPGDRLITGDWDRDGSDDVGVVRPQADGLLHWYLDTDGDPLHEREHIFGLPGDQPIVGDWQMPEVGVSGVPARGLSFQFGTGRAPSHLEQTFEIENTGTVDLHVGVQGSAEFEVAGNTTVRPGATEKITVRALSALQDRPPTSFLSGVDSSGSRYTVSELVGGMLHIHTNDGNEELLTIPLRVSVYYLGPEIVPNQRPEITLLDDGRHLRDGATVSFGQIRPNTTLRRTLTIRNDGNLPLDLHGHGRTVVADGGSSRIRILGNVTGQLQPRQSRQITVEVDTSRTGRFRERIQLLSNDSNEGHYEIYFTGEVKPASSSGPEITVIEDGREVRDGGTLSFGRVDQNTRNARKELTIRNDGDRAPDSQRPPIQPNNHFGARADQPPSHHWRPPGTD